MKQGILHVPTGRWLIFLDEDKAILCHDPGYIQHDFTQQFGETRLHSILNTLRHRDKFTIRSFTLDHTTSVKVR